MSNSVPYLPLPDGRPIGAMALYDPSTGESIGANLSASLGVPTVFDSYVFGSDVGPITVRVETYATNGEPGHCDLTIPALASPKTATQLLEDAGVTDDVYSFQGIVLSGQVRVYRGALADFATSYTNDARTYSVGENLVVGTPPYDAIRSQAIIPGQYGVPVTVGASSTPTFSYSWLCEGYPSTAIRITDVHGGTPSVTLVGTFKGGSTQTINSFRNNGWQASSPNAVALNDVLLIDHAQFASITLTASSDLTFTYSVSPNQVVHSTIFDLLDVGSYTVNSIDYRNVTSYVMPGLKLPTIHVIQKKLGPGYSVVTSKAYIPNAYNAQTGWTAGAANAITLLASQGGNVRVAMGVLEGTASADGVIFVFCDGTTATEICRTLPRKAFDGKAVEQEFMQRSSGQPILVYYLHTTGSGTINAWMNMRYSPIRVS